MPSATAATVAAFLRFVRALSLSDGQHPGRVHQPERRAAERHRVHTCVDVVPLDARHVPCGRQRLAVVRDVSDIGIQLISSLPPQTAFLRVCLPVGSGESAEVLVEVVRLTPEDDLGTVGGRFVPTGGDDLHLPTRRT